MQTPEPSYLEYLLRVTLNGLASNATTILVTATAAVVFGLGPVGRGLGQLLATLRHKRDALQDPRVTDSLNDVAERLDFVERALTALRDPRRGNPRLPEETKVPTPV